MLARNGRLGSETETRELLAGMEEKKIPNFALQANHDFF